jgi:putative membrane protein
MDRRVLLAGIATAAVSAPALAQTSGSSTMQPGQSGAAQTMNRMGHGGQMSQAEMQHMQDTMRLGMVSLETSRIAQQKAQNAELKGFALFEVQEQEVLAEVLRSMMDPQATAATAGQQGTSSQSGMQNMANMQMDQQGQQMVQRLQQASGQEFDRMYLEGQLQGHRDLLQVQDRYISSNPQNREHLNVAKLARGHIREHVAVLQALQQRMR